ncbi:hypothetical protein FEI15_08850 [Lacticaseibacillus zeae]|uniref:Uncharacterized protein n=1 Tax=Lacticaseibacillus zeae TaxID=57037 RepID=A0A5R8LPH2_LACZE|nr:hypothetical protein FEI15_08850 [Lacticaseibacillus zeae]
MYTKSLHVGAEVEYFLHNSYNCKKTVQLQCTTNLPLDCNGDQLTNDAGTVYYVKPSPVSKEVLKTTATRPNRYAAQTFVLSFTTMTWDN